MAQESYIEKFERVVDALRTTGTYTAVLVTTDVYQVVSDVDTYLDENDYVTIDNYKVRVRSIVDSKTFNAQLFGQVPSLSGTWKALAPYSDYGTRKTINLKLMQKNGGEFSYQKYPLIALRLPVEIAVDSGEAEFDANILIANFTNKHYKPQDRIANVFEPILWPLKQQFIDMIRKSGDFNGLEPDYSWIDRLFYGTETGEENIANVFDDPLDAVEIRNLKLKFFIDDCI